MTDFITNALARIHVRETSGIRRFLYPLHVSLPPLPDSVELAAVSLALPDGTPVPCQLTQAGTDAPRLDFAVFLAPFEQMTLTLSRTGPQAAVDDPLQLEPQTEKVLFVSTQKRLVIAVTGNALLRDVTYDGIDATRDLFTLTRNGCTAQAIGFPTQSPANRAHLSAWATARGQYPDRVNAVTNCELTACKSWVNATHTLETPKAGDCVTFTLPLAVHAPTLLCDFGAGGGTYGKLQAASSETITWRTQFSDEGTVKWSIALNGRTDYAGAAQRDAYHAAQWFHVIDSNKALAVAITHVPASCRALTVTLGANGDVAVDFTLGESTHEPATFGVCWHFLNGVPAVSAATNPQSILLPPLVDVEASQAPHPAS